jgi:hypothetical protein
LLYRFRANHFIAAYRGMAAAAGTFTGSIRAAHAFTSRCLPVAAWNALLHASALLVALLLAAASSRIIHRSR